MDVVCVGVLEESLGLCNWIFNQYIAKLCIVQLLWLYNNVSFLIKKVIILIKTKIKDCTYVYLLFNYQMFALTYLSMMFVDVPNGMKRTKSLFCFLSVLKQLNRL